MGVLKRQTEQQRSAFTPHHNIFLHAIPYLYSGELSGSDPKTNDESLDLAVCLITFQKN